MTIIGPNKRKQSHSKRLALDIRARVLEHCEDYTKHDAGPVMGLGLHDVGNLRGGKGVSLLMFVRLITKGRYSPKSIIWGKTLRRLAKRTSTRAVSPAQITKRIRQITLTEAPLAVAKATGLSSVTIYELRTKPPKSVSLHTLLSFLESGYSLDSLVFGRKK